MSVENTMTGEHVEPLVLGRYMLCDAIGGGGMARVHVGRVIGAAGFSRVVAIKRLHPASANDPDFSTMIIDEARLASRVRHPNVVPTLDVVAVGRELLLVMEYVHGISVAQLVRLARIKTIPIPLSIALRIAQDTLAGLGAAHEAKSERGRPLELVHRDISPQNVLLGTDGIAKIVDFGIAKAEGKLTMTRDGQIKGKLAYMAPEQLRGEEVDRRTDIYAVGVMLWELLTGKRLFERRADDLVAALQNVTTSLVPPPSNFVSAPFALDTILAKALEPEPADRFPTADAMSSAIDALAMTASAKDLAAFVNDLAKAQLEKRSDVVNRAEQTSEIHNLPPDVQARIQEAVRAAPLEAVQRGSRPSYASHPSHPPLPIYGGAPPPVTGPPPPVAPLGEHTGTPIRVPMDRPRKSIFVVVLIGGAAALLLLIVLGKSCSHLKTPTAAVVNVSATGQVPAPPTLSATDDDIPPPMPSGNVPTPSNTVIVPGPSTTRVIHHGPNGPPVPSRSATKPDCNPPYRIDERGIRIPRRECFDQP